jgi:hypothetical protein
MGPDVRRCRVEDSSTVCCKYIPAIQADLPVELSWPPAGVTSEYPQIDLLVILFEYRF